LVLKACPLYSPGTPLPNTLHAFCQLPSATVLALKRHPVHSCVFPRPYLLRSLLYRPHPENTYQTRLITTGALTGTPTGTRTDSLTGTLSGAFTGTLTGAFTDSLTGTLTGAFTGTLTGAFTDSLTGTLTGAFTGTLTGAFTGTLTGAFTGTLTGTLLVHLQANTYQTRLTTTGAFTGALTTTVKVTTTGTQAQDELQARKALQSPSPPILRTNTN